MKELDKSKVYDLSELTDEQFKYVLKKVGYGDFIEKISKKTLYYSFKKNQWLASTLDKKCNANAKELFESEYEVKYIAEAPKEDKPIHYANGIDTFERMEANCTLEECLAFAKGNIDKYNWRTKNQDLEDYTKIIAYANWAIKLLNKKENE